MGIIYVLRVLGIYSKLARLDKAKYLMPRERLRELLDQLAHSLCGCCPKLGVHFLAVLPIGALLVGIDTRALGPLNCGSSHVGISPKSDPNRNRQDSCQPEKNRCTPTPPNVPLLRALWSLLDGIWGPLKGSWGVLA